MLNAKENLREVIKGGNPDRFSNNYEAITLLMHPFAESNPGPTKGGPNIPNAWGVMYSWPENVPGGFPVHTPEYIVVKDIEDWKEYVKAPNLKFDQATWDRWKQIYDDVDGSKTFKAAFVAPGLFEQSHHLCSMQEVLVNYAMYDEEMHDLIKYLVDFELELAEGICSNLHPDAMLHHDDWGGEESTFLSPAMFEDYFLDAYKQIYGYYKEHGCELIIHHSDSYAATLVPDMIEMGIDIWQGCMHSNNVPDLIKKYGKDITFMGEIDNKFIDFDGWTREDCKKAARDAMDACGINYFVPCITQGGPGSVYPGAYDVLIDEIDNYNCELFGLNKDEIIANRLPTVIMF